MDYRGHQIKDCNRVINPEKIASDIISVLIEMEYIVPKQVQNQHEYFHFNGQGHQYFIGGILRGFMCGTCNADYKYQIKRKGTTVE